MTQASGRSWFAISWFTIWGLFQGFAVFSVLAGRWARPEAFPEGAYESLVYPDLFFIPLYLLAAILLFRRHWLGGIVACIAGGGIIYAMIYLLALSEFSSAANLAADGLFLALTISALLQVGYRVGEAGAR